jgi:hypothetical protein
LGVVLTSENQKGYEASHREPPGSHRETIRGIREAVRSPEKRNQLDLALFPVLTPSWCLSESFYCRYDLE